MPDSKFEMSLHSKFEIFMPDLLCSAPQTHSHPSKVERKWKKGITKKNKRRSCDCYDLPWQALVPNFLPHHWLDEGHWKKTKIKPWESELPDVPTSITLFEVKFQTFEGFCCFFRCSRVNILKSSPILAISSICANFCFRLSPLPILIFIHASLSIMKSHPRF